MTDPSQSRHILALDGVRGTAFLMVLVFHSFEIWRRPDLGFILNYVQDIVMSLWFGVDLFFVLSGFLITRILIKSRTSQRYFPDFYWKRCLRIFPVYFLYLLLAFLWLRFNANSFGEVFSPAHISYWIYLQNWVVAKSGYDSFRPLAHLWSLAIEEQYYLVWPFLVLWVRPTYLLRVTLSILLVAFAVRILLVGTGGFVVANYVSTVTRMDTLAAGALLAIVEQNDDWRKWLSHRATTLIAIGLASIVSISIWRHGYEIRDGIVRTLGFFANTIFCAGIVAAAAFHDSHSRTSKIFSPTWLRWVGSRSYAAYLFHWPITLLAAYVINQNGIEGTNAITLTLAIVLPTTLLVAELSWQLYEKHWLALK